jgi:hypothetical protein
MIIKRALATSMVFALAISGLGTAVSASAATVSANSGTVSGFQSLITKSLAAKSLPSNLSPKFSEISNEDKIYNAQGTSWAVKCQGENKDLASNPIACYYGNTKATKTIVLFGDSNAGNWVPAFDVAAKQLGYKLAIYIAAGCDSQLASGSDRPVCVTWQKNVARSVAKEKPIAVFSAKLAMALEGNKGNTDWFAGKWKTAFETITSNNASIKRFLLGSTPNSGSKASLVACLTTQTKRTNYNKALKACSPKYKMGKTGANELWTYLDADKASASKANATLIDTTAWFCQNSKTAVNICPIVIGNRLVYVDNDHLSTGFAQSIGPALAEALKEAGL